MIDIQTLMNHISEICPNATIGEDNDGQIVIYTNMQMISSDGHMVDMDEKENNNG